MSESKKATIYTVAKKANVSITTVSRVLNTPQLVRKDTREKVLSVIDELGFIPQASARAYAQKMLGRIGILTPFFTRPSFVQRMRGVASILAEKGIELIIFPVNSIAQVYHLLSTIPITQRIDGLITISLPFDNENAQRIIKNKLETVSVEFQHPLFSNIIYSNEYGGQLAGEHLLSKHHELIAFIGEGQLAEYSMNPGISRLNGLKKAVRNRGRDIEPDYIVHPDQKNVLPAIHHLLNLKYPPTAIFAENDELAFQILKVARKRGIKIPQDLAIIGFDDLDVSEYIGLTTVSQKLDESGKIAARMLLERIANPGMELQNVELELTVVERGTVEDIG